jgi:hypothetical protein
MGASLAEFGEGLRAIVTAADNVGAAANSVGAAAGTLASNAALLSQRLSTYPPPTIPTAGVDAIATAAAAASTDSGDSFSLLSTSATSLGEVDTLVSGQETIINTVPVAEAAVFGAFLLLFLVTLLPLGLCKCFHVILSPVMIVFVIVIWVVCGVLLLVALVAADICVDFDSTLLRIVANGDAALALVGASATYYLTCDTNPAVSTNNTFVGFAQLANSSLAGIAGDVAQLEQLKQDPRLTPSDVGLIDTVQTDFAGVQTSASAVVTSLGCSALNTPLNQVIDAVCVSFVNDGFVPFWGIQAACAVLLAIILVLK